MLATHTGLTVHQCDSDFHHMDSEACNSSPKAHWPHTHTHSARQDTVLPARDRQDTALSCWTDLEGGLGHAPLYLNLFCDSEQDTSLESYFPHLLKRQQTRGLVMPMWHTPVLLGCLGVKC